MIGEHKICICSIIRMGILVSITPPVQTSWSYLLRQGTINGHAILVHMNFQFHSRCIMFSVESVSSLLMNSWADDLEDNAEAEESR